MSATGAAGRYVSTAVDGAVARVTWSRPERRNAIGREVAGELAAALEAISTRADVAVVLLRSAAEPFCSGWDVRDFDALHGASAERAAGFFTHGRRLLGTVGSLPQIVIAAPIGATLGFGCALLARCDIVLAPADATFALPEIRRGMPPATVIPELLEVMPRRAVLAWSVLGAAVGAEAARADGLVTEVVPAAAHAEALEACVTRIASQGAALVRETKALLARIATAAPDERVRIGVDAALARFLAGSASAGGNR